MQRIWKDWATRANVPKGTRVQGRLAWTQCLEVLVVPPPPDAWTSLEAPLRRATTNLNNTMLVPDDRDKGKCWLVPTASMATHLEMALEAFPMIYGESTKELG